LSTTQGLFWAAITHPTGVTDFLDQADEATRSLFEAIFSESAEFARAERLDVYASGYFFRLLDVLKEMFPVVHWRVGAEHFHNLVVDFLLAHPSSNPNLRHLGDALPAYVATHILSDSVPELADFARVELAISRALDAADARLLTAATLSTVPPAAWATLRFRFVPSVELLQLRCDYQSAREAERAGEPPAPNMNPGLETHLLVWRKQFQVFTRNLHTSEAVFLSSLLRGESFGAASQKLEQLGADAVQVVEYLDRWLRDELVCDSAGG
jgi:hypothetical protein